MPRPTSSRFRTLLITLLLAFAASAPSHASPQTSDEAALGELAARYFAAYAGRDLDALMKCWSALSPQYVARRRLMERLFTGTDYKFSNVRVTGVRVDGAGATMRVSADRTAFDRGKRVVTESKVLVTFTLVKEGNEWKVWADASAVGDFAGALLEAQDGAARRALLEAEPEMVSRDLQLVLQSRLDRLFAQSDYARALVAAALLRDVSERLDDQAEVAAAWHKIGILHFMQAAHPHALDAYRRSLALEEKLGRQAEAARVLSSIALTHSALGEYATALAHYRRSLALHESLGNKSGVADTLESIGKVYYEQGDYAAAAEQYRASLLLRDAATERAGIAATLTSLAELHYDQGQDEHALGYYRDALARLDARTPRTAVGRVLHTVANIHYGRGDYAAAVIHYRRALAEQEAANNAAGAAAALQGIGQAHALQGNFTHALDAYQKELAIRRRLDERREVAAALGRVGLAHFQVGDYRAALDRLHEALYEREQLGDQKQIGWALLDIGVVQAAQGDLVAALRRYGQSLSLFEAAGEWAGVGSALLGLSGVHFAEKKYDAALAHAERATTLARQTGSAELLWQARHKAGRVHFRLGQLATAAIDSAKACSAVASLKAAAGGSRQQRVFDNRLAPYLGLADTLLADGRFYEALNFAERARSRTLRWLIEGGRVRITKTMTAPEREREQRLLTSLAALTAQAQREQMRERPNPSRLAAVRDDTRRTRQDYDAFLRQLFARRPALKLFRGEAEPVKAEQLGALTGDARTAWLEFVETEEQVYLFVLTKARRAAGRAGAATGRITPTAARLPAIQVYGLGVTGGLIADRAAKLLDSIISRGDGYEPLARELYNLLLKPAAAHLSGKTRLVIIPDGALWSVPFQALLNDRQRFLIEDYALAYSPSLTAMSVMSVMSASRRAAQRRGATGRLVAFGNPTLSPAAVEQLKAIRLTETLQALPETAGEVAALGKLFGSAEGKTFIGAEASEDRARAEAPHSRALHFAAPATLNDASPFFTHVALSPPGDDAPGDGLLEMREVIGWDLRADVAVFSAGETLPKRVHSGRSLTGLAWALFVAGCPATLVSQWRADAPSTAELMLEFHRRLRTSPAVMAEAWRAAALGVIRSGESRHPFYWSGFSLLGGAR
jgi:CHAT domain-containing protein/tetratricopeptide (TPR) repeat protein